MELTPANQAMADMLLSEIGVLNEMIEGMCHIAAQCDMKRWREERQQLIKKLNKIYGTDHYNDESKIIIV